MSRNLKTKPRLEPLDVERPQPAAFIPLEEASDIEGSPAIALREQLRSALADPVRAPFAGQRTIRDGSWSPRAKLLFIAGSGASLWGLIIIAGRAIFH